MTIPPRPPHPSPTHPFDPEEWRAHIFAQLPPPPPEINDDLHKKMDWEEIVSAELDAIFAMIETFYETHEANAVVRRVVDQRETYRHPSNKAKIATALNQERTAYRARVRELELEHQDMLDQIATLQDRIRAIKREKTRLTADRDDIAERTKPVASTNAWNSYVNDMFAERVEAAVDSRTRVEDQFEQHFLRFVHALVNLREMYNRESPDSTPNSPPAPFDMSAHMRVAAPFLTHAHIEKYGAVPDPANPLPANPLPPVLPVSTPSVSPPVPAPPIRPIPAEYIISNDAPPPPRRRGRPPGSKNKPKPAPASAPRLSPNPSPNAD